MAKQLSRFSFSVDALAAVRCRPSGRPDKSGRVYVYDTRVPGLAFCVTEGGARNFYLCRRVAGRYQRVKLGTPAEWTVERARRRAGELNSGIAKGDNPQAEKLARRTEATFGELWESYIDGHARQHKRPTSVAEDERLHRMHLKAWDGRRLSEITAGDVDLLKTRIGKTSPTTANRILALLSCMYRKRGHLFGLPRHFSPTTGAERYRENARDRVLTPAELSAVLAALQAEENATVRDYFLLALYTGARRSNVAAMRWEDVNLERRVWMLPGESTKNGAALTVPLVPAAVDVLEKRGRETPYVFPAKRITGEQQARAKALEAAGTATRAIAAELGVSQTAVVRMLAPGFIAGEAAPLTGVGKAWERIRTSAGITERTTIHDLRRTFCTAMLEAGVQLPHVSAAMGHKTMATTQKHYAIARADKVRESVQAGVAGMLAGVAKLAEKAQAAPTVA